MADWAGPVLQGALETSVGLIPRQIRAAVRSGPVWKRLIALLRAVTIIIVGAAGCAAIIILVIALVSAAIPNRDPLSSSEVVYQGTSKNSLRNIEHCLLEGTAGALNLRKKLSPPPSKDPVIRVDNPIRHIIIDVYDKGSARIVSAYSRDGKALYQAEIDAINHCKLGDI